MLININEWMVRKKEFWNRLWEDLEIGYLDEDLLPLLIRLNMDKNVYTLSSCSGRIVFSDSTYPWSREETSIVFKKHEPITLKDFYDVVDKPVIRRLWLNVTGPIIHVSTCKPSYTSKILKLARIAGLKHSGILSINRSKGIILELMSGIKVTQLIKVDNKVFINDERVEEFIDIVNKTLLEGKKLVFKLTKLVEKELPVERDDFILNDLENRLADKRIKYI